MAILKLLKISSVDNSRLGSDKSNILQQGVPQIFATWIDRLCYCLGQLSFITDCESMEKNIFRSASNQNMKMFCLID